MRRFAVGVALLVVAGCRTAPSGGPPPGAATPQAAVLQFVEAARAQDLQAVSAVWGNSESPTRDRVERQELERRILIMMCHLRHEESRIDPAQMGEGGRTIFPVELVQGTRKATTPFTTIRNDKTGRWFVEDFDMRPMREFCSAMPVRTPG